MKQFFLPPNDGCPIDTAQDLSRPDFYESTPSGAAMDHWYLIINKYVKRGLTLEQDRLPALSGIARQIQKRSGYRYKAGIWAEDVHVGLLWSSNGIGRKRENIACPSWTWAGGLFAGLGDSNPPYNIWSGPRSITKTVFPTLIHSRALIKEIAIEGGEEISGAVMSGTISIEGKIQSAEDWKFRYPLPLLYKKGERFDLSDLVKSRDYAEPVTDSPHILCELAYHENWPDDWTQENKAQFENNIAFLQIYRLSGCEDGYGYSIFQGYEKLGIAYALMIESTGKEGEYRRRGIAEIPCENGMADNGWDIRTVNIV